MGSINPTPDGRANQSSSLGSLAALGSMVFCPSMLATAVLCRDGPSLLGEEHAPFCAVCLGSCSLPGTSRLAPEFPRLALYKGGALELFEPACRLNLFRPFSLQPWLKAGIQGLLPKCTACSPFSDQRSKPTNPAPSVEL